MSMEQARRFIERIKTDEAFRKKLAAVEDVAERMNMAREEGYDCTAEEIEKISMELEDTDLDGVAAAKLLCRNMICFG